MLFKTTLVFKCKYKHVFLEKNYKLKVKFSTLLYGKPVVRDEVLCESSYNRLRKFYNNQREKTINNNQHWKYVLKLKH